MGSRIIKQGTVKACSIQQFSFSEMNSVALVFDDKPVWADLVSEPSPAAPVAVLPEDLSNPLPDVAQLEKAAFENGFRQGEKVGLEAAERKLEAVMKRYADTILQVGGIKASLYAQAEREVAQLSIEVAKKIVHREIQVDKDIIQTLVHVALTHVAEKSAVTVYLNPVDYGYLLERRAEFSQSEGRDISLLSDKSIEQGGCLIQTDCGDIDARIDEQFREVEQAFFEGMK
jgi:flagellar assembly protein FliH